MFCHANVFYCLIISPIASQNFPHCSLSPISLHATHLDLREHMDIYDLLKLFHSVLTQTDAFSIVRHSQSQTMYRSTTFSLVETFVRCKESFKFHWEISQLLG